MVLSASSLSMAFDHPPVSINIVSAIEYMSDLFPIIAQMQKNVNGLHATGG